MPNLSAVPPPASIRTLTAGEQLAQLDSARLGRARRCGAAAEPVPALHLGARVARRAELRVRARASSWPSAPAASSVSRRSSCSGTGAARIASFVGSHESALGDILLGAGRGALRTARMLLDAVVASARPDALDVFGLPAASNLARAAGERMTLVERVEAPVTEMPEGWEEAYTRHASSKRRSTDRRRERQLERARQPRVLARHRRRRRAREICRPRSSCIACAGRAAPTARRSARPAASGSSATRCRASPDEGHFAMLTVRIDGKPGRVHELVRDRQHASSSTATATTRPWAASGPAS